MLQTIPLNFELRFLGPKSEAKSEADVKRDSESRMV